jgi:hypothetical protein
MFDQDETIRKFINMQYVKMKHLSAVGSLVLLTLNLSFVLYPYIEHRLPETYFTIIQRAWIGIPTIFFVTLLLVWSVAHFYVKKMEMYRTEKRADIMFNPYQVYAFQPFWEMWWRDVYIPQMKSQLAQMKHLKKLNPSDEFSNDISYLQDEIKKVENWLDLGYIPKKDFPKHLRKYYITKKESRL